MALTRAQAQKMIGDRLREYPELGTVVAAPDFKKTLLDIIRFEGIEDEWYSIIENELLVVLALYAPIGELAKNISETTGIPLDTCKRIALMIDTLLLESIHDQLVSFEMQWQTQLEVEQKQAVVQVPPAPKPTQEPLPKKTEVVMTAPSPEREAPVVLKKEEMPQAPPTPPPPAAPVQKPAPEQPGTLPKIESKLRDKLELRPDMPSAASASAAPAPNQNKPLDKNDLLDYLNVKHTMAADIAVAQSHTTGATTSAVSAASAVPPPPARTATVPPPPRMPLPPNAAGATPLRPLRTPPPLTPPPPPSGSATSLGR